MKIKNLKKILKFIKTRGGRKTPLAKNIFKTHYKKNVLISYINPYATGIGKSHTNFVECATACEIFSKLKYNVDIIIISDLLDKKSIAKYDVVYGQGETFVNSIDVKNVVSILYPTGCSSDFSNAAADKRLEEFYNKTGVLAKNSVRYAPVYIPLKNIDGIVALGNDFIKNTFSKRGKNTLIESLPLFCHKTCDIDVDKKDFSKIKNNFLWFGSSGAITKGVDIVIDLFKKRKDINLTICGVFLREKALRNYYSDVFANKCDNIKVYGFISVESKEFEEIMKNNIGIIFPTAADACPGAVITPMRNGGLIPIISECAGIDSAKYGYTYSELSVNALNEKIDKFLNTPVEELKELSKKVKEEAEQTYNLENYRNNLERIITKILKEKGQIIE